MRKFAGLILMREVEYDDLLNKQAVEVKAAREDGRFAGVREEAQRVKKIGFFYRISVRRDDSEKNPGKICFGEIPETSTEYFGNTPQSIRMSRRLTAVEALDQKWRDFDPSAEKFLQELGLL